MNNYKGVGYVTIILILGATLITQVARTNSLTEEHQEEVEQHKEDKAELQKDNNILNKNIKQLKEELDKEKQEKAEKEKHNKELQKKIESKEKQHKEEIQKLKKELKPPSRSRSVGSRTLLGTFEATAYTDNVESQGKWVGQTATGMKPRVGVIAVDPNVIPLGTKLYVEGYGNCIAGDTGGAIKGNRVDLFMNTREECYNWGRKNVKVYKRN